MNVLNGSRNATKFLAQSVGSLTHTIEAVGNNINAVTKNVAEVAKNVNAVTQMVAILADTVAKIAVIVQSHENRLEDLEGGA